MSRSLLLRAAAVAAMVAAGCAPDPGSSIEQATEVQSDLTAIFTRELGTEPDEVVARRNEERCDGVRGAALELRSTWHSEPEPARLEAAMGAVREYLDDRATGIDEQPDDGDPRVGSADLGLPVADAWETWAGGVPGGAMVRTFSACLDPAAIAVP